MLAGHAGEVVLVRVEQLPVIARQPVELLEGRADVHELQAVPARLTVHARVVELHERAADLAVVDVDARQHQTFAVLGRQTGQIVDGSGVFTAAEGKAGEIHGTHTRGASAILPYMSPARHRKHS